MENYIVIAGAVPILHHVKVIEKDGKLVKAKQEIVIEGEKTRAIWPVESRYLKKGDVIPESFFKDAGDISAAVNGKFIEAYEPVKVTAADLKKHPHLVEHFNLKEGDEVHNDAKHKLYAQSPKIDPATIKKG